MKIAGDDLPITLVKCPECGWEMNGVTQMGSAHTEQPAPGDHTVCINCTAWLAFTEDLSLRRFTVEDVAGLSFEEHRLLMQARHAIQLAERQSRR